MQAIQGVILTISDYIALGAAVIALLGVFLNARQVTLLRKQFAESRLNFLDRYADLSAAIGQAFHGSVRACHVNCPLGVPVITVSEELDGDLRDHLSDLMSRYG